MAPSQAEAQSWSLILTRYEKETPAKGGEAYNGLQGAIASRASHFGVNSETADWLSFLHIDVQRYQECVRLSLESNIFVI
jgi:hypothetical protein